MFKDKITKLTSGAVLLASASSFTSLVQANPGSTFSVSENSGSEKLAKELQNSSFFRKNPVLWSVGAVLVILGVSYALILLDKWVKLKSLEKEIGSISLYEQLTNEANVLEARKIEMEGEIQNKTESVNELKEQLRRANDEISKKKDVFDKKIKDIEAYEKSLTEEISDIKESANYIDIFYAGAFAPKTLKDLKKELDSKKGGFTVSFNDFTNLVKSDFDKDLNISEKIKDVNKLGKSFESMYEISDLLNKEKAFIEYSTALENCFPNKDSRDQYVKNNPNSVYARILDCVKQLEEYISLNKKINELERKISVAKRYSDKKDEKEFHDEMFNRHNYYLCQLANWINALIKNTLHDAEDRTKMFDKWQKVIECSVFSSVLDKVKVCEKNLKDDVKNLKKAITEEKEGLEKKKQDIEQNLKDEESHIKNLETNLEQVKEFLIVTENKLNKVESEIKGRYNSDGKLNVSYEDLVNYKEKIEKNFWYPNSFPGQHSLFS